MDYLTYYLADMAVRNRTHRKPVKLKRLGFAIIALIILIVSLLERVPAPTEVSAASSDTQEFSAEPSQVERIVEIEVVRYVVITPQLPDDYNAKKDMVMARFQQLGHSREELNLIDHIVFQESRYNQNSEAPTLWYQCSDSRFVELIQYPAGGYWQDYCENYGLTAIDQGKTRGLLHIIRPTAQEFGCDYNPDGDYSWLAETECASKIIKAGAVSRWASYYSYTN
jgi:hypothetical protein